MVVTEPGPGGRRRGRLRAGAEDRLTRGELPDSMVPRVLRYAVERHRLRRELRRELATTDDVTGLPNLRGFAPIAEHHLRMADRTGEPVVFLFVRLAATRPDVADAAEVLRRGRPRRRRSRRAWPTTRSAVLLTGKAPGRRGAWCCRG